MYICVETDNEHGSVFLRYCTVWKEREGMVIEHFHLFLICYSCFICLKVMTSIFTRFARKYIPKSFEFLNIIICLLSFIEIYVATR